MTRPEFALLSFLYSMSFKLNILLLIISLKISPFSFIFSLTQNNRKFLLNFKLMKLVYLIQTLREISEITVYIYIILKMQNQNPR